MPLQIRFNNPRTFLSSATRTSNGQSNSFQLGNYSQATIFLDITAISGSLDAAVQFSPDDIDWYDTIYSFTSFTSVGREALSLNNFPRYVRIKYSITGSVTFSIKSNLKT